MVILIKYLILLLIINFINCSIDEAERLIEEMVRGTPDKTTKNYPLKTLFYVSPWNNDRYSVVEEYAKKIDILSPAWFEIKHEEIDGEFNMILDGGGNVDTQFMKRLRANNKNIEILPRLHCGAFEQRIHDLWMNRGIDNFIKILERRIKYNKYDGFVFDCIYFWSENKKYEDFKHKLLPKMKELMNKLNKKLILTCLPIHSDISIIDRSKLKFLAENVDYINIMTYDYPNHRGQKKFMYNSPINWIKSNIQDFADENDINTLSKILFGLPFYGYGFNKETAKHFEIITGEGLYDKLKNKKNKLELKWDEQEKEHLVEVDGQIFSCPTREFIKERLELSKKLKIGGCGVWEIGFAIEYFFEPF